MNPPHPRPNPPTPKRTTSGRYSIWRLLREGLRRQRGWQRAWAKPTPRTRYRVVIVGGGGHGLSTAFHLAAEHGITDVAVLERGPIGLGNVGRNTTIIRSNYFHPDNIRFYELSLRLWERLEKELNFNAMVSQRGTLNLFHPEAQRDCSPGAPIRCGSSVSTPRHSAPRKCDGSSRSRTWKTAATRCSEASCSRAEAPCGTMRWRGVTHARPPQ